MHDLGFVHVIPESTTAKVFGESQVFLHDLFTLQQVY